MNGAVALEGLVLVLFLMVVLWALSLGLRDASVVDAFWGSGFVVLAWFYAVRLDGSSLRGSLVLVLTTIWGVRLSLHLLDRMRGKPEDYRYAARRESSGSAFWWQSLLKVFLLQGLLMWLIAAPALIAQSPTGPESLTALDLLGVAIWLVGFLFESIGDAQLRQFKRDPANRGRVLDTGLWAYTRHPNYFGDSLVWWGLWLVSISVPGTLWSIYSPVLMTLLLVKVSGAALLEKGLRATKPQYAEYENRVSAFLPRPPRKPRLGSDDEKL